MSFIRNLFGGETATEEISKIAPISECSAECDVSECSTTFPNSVRLDESVRQDKLWKTAKPYALHLLISTGKTDWPHDALADNGTLQNSISKWSKKAKSEQYVGGGNINVSVTSIPINDSDPDCLKFIKGDVLILPYFVWIKQCHVNDIENVLDELIPQLYKANEEGKLEADIGLPKKLANGTTIEISKFNSLIFLCSHRTRDKKCGVTAPLMKREMDHHLRDKGLLRDFGDDRPGGVAVYFLNHVGGHKYAANVIIYLKNGEYVWFAKCKPQNCKPIIEETVLGGGKVFPQLVRNVQKCNPIKW